MGVVVGIISGVLCAILYVRMYRREEPEKIDKKKAALPVILGIIAPLFSTVMLMGIGLVFRALTGGKAVKDLVDPMVLQALISSFVSAGFTEELGKGLFLLLTVAIVKPRNVFEYGFLGAGVGFGFTVLEDILYGGGGLVVAVPRLFTFALHMVFGLLMGTHFGLARYRRREGRSGLLHGILGFCLPVLWHTVFDASNAFNGALNAEDEGVQLAGMVISIVITVASVVLQFVVLARFRKKTAAFCGMSLVPSAAPGTSSEAGE